MKKLFQIMFLFSFVCGLSIAQDAVDRAEVQTGATVVPIITIGELQYDSPDASLYDNGPLVTHPGGMPNGYDLSSLQSVSLPGMNILGYGAQIVGGNSVADDFTVPAGGWQIDQIQFFTYQTGSTLTSTINDVRVQIWNGPPNAGGSVVYGDLITNRLATINGTGFSSIYRSAESVPPGTTRPIMVVKANINTTLAAGTYWVQWSMGGTLGSGPWAPPVTILGQKQKPGSNALQYNTTSMVWTPLVDDTTFAQDLPFVITGGTTGAWTTNTTSVGRVYGMVLNPGNPNVMYTCTGVAPGGVNKTTDGGLTWAPKNSGLTNQVIQALGICKSSPNVLYAGTAPGANEGVYKTTNGGETWTNVSTGIAEPAGTIGIQAIAVHPTNPLIAWCTVFSGTADAVNGIYKTIDGGTTWTVSNTGIGTIKNFLSLTTLDGTVLYAGSSLNVALNAGPTEIYKSIDGGANWVLSSTGLPIGATATSVIRCLEISEFNPNVVIAGLFMNTTDGGFYLSTDAGANWTKKHNGLPTAAGTLIRSVAIRPGTDNEFLVGLDRSTGTDIGVRRTTDGGNNWTTFNSGTMLDTYGVRALKFKAGTNPTIYGGVGTVTGAGVYEQLISGVITTPIFAVSPAAKNYGGIYIGSSSADQTFIISNTGAGTLTITAGNISITGADASQFVLTDANTYPINLTGGQSATVDVKFSPTSAGAKAANLQIVHNAAGSPGLVALTGTGITPPTIPYTTDFESFTATPQIACQDPVNWTTWSQLPCSAEDAFISTNYAHSGTKSFVIIPGNDFVKPLANQTTGTWTITFWVYMPTGKGGYFNTLNTFPAGATGDWGMEVYFDVGGAGRLLNGVTPVPGFTWTENTWQECKVVIDLDADVAQFWYNGTQVGTNWSWSRAGTQLKRIAGNDFYGPLQTVADECYFDDYSFQSAATTFQLTVNIANGWNMVSIPGLHPTDQHVNTWWAFRDVGANVFKYAGGYQPITTATPGIGYWMKHTGVRTYNTGEEWPAGGIQKVPHTPLAGAAGWNLIGGYDNIATASLVTTNPPGQQSGPIYKYAGGYSVATTLDPGNGYWIKLLSAAQIILPETLAKDVQPVEYFPGNWGKIVLTDATGINYTLYAVKGKTDLSQYELPPAPPTGMFDIRFSSGRIAEDINSAIKTIDMSGVTYPLTVRVEGMDIRLMDETGKNINVDLKSGEDVVISDATISKLMVSGEMIPAVYALEQNYPNPFNPSTVIEFSLPEDVGNVKLSIYNALGEKVAELVNTALTAGKYQYQWNAQNVATGMYIYELRTDKFVSVKKMMLMK